MKSESKLVLLAEMKTPGEALLEIKMEDLNHDQCKVILLARFLPKGLTGLLYWYVLYPFHQYVFTQMLKGLVNHSNLKFVTQPNRYVPDSTKTCRLPDK